MSKVARRIAEDLIFDLSDRRGLSHAWDGIDEEIRQGIRNVWELIVDQRLKEKGKPGRSIDMCDRAQRKVEKRS